MPSFLTLMERYRALFGAEAVPARELQTMEDALSHSLPADFREVAGFYRGGYLGGKSHHAIAASGSAANIVDETLRLRRTIRLPRGYVVLAEPPESLIVMDCSEGGSVVTWCDASDASRVGREALPGAQVWPSYAAFFEYLVREEEAERSE